MPIKEVSVLTIYSRRWAMSNITSEQNQVTEVTQVKSLNERNSGGNLSQNSQVTVGDLQAVLPDSLSDLTKLDFNKINSISYI